jgi:hypothetical protein
MVMADQVLIHGFLDLKCRASIANMYTTNSASKGKRRIENEINLKLNCGYVYHWPGKNGITWIKIYKI